jgi:PAS domain S-box-containing protein
MSDIAEKLSRLDELKERLIAADTVTLSITLPSVDGVVVADTEGRIVFANPSAHEAFGYEGTEMVGLPITALMPERYHEQHRRGFARYLETREPRLMDRIIRLDGLKKDGEEFPILLSLHVLENTDLHFVAVIRDPSTVEIMKL